MTNIRLEKNHVTEDYEEIVMYGEKEKKMESPNQMRNRTGAKVDVARNDICMERGIPTHARAVNTEYVYQNCKCIRRPVLTHTYYFLISDWRQKASLTTVKALRRHSPKLRRRYCEVAFFYIVFVVR